VLRSFEALSIKLSAASGKRNSSCNHESQTILETIIDSHNTDTYHLCVRLISKCLTLPKNYSLKNTSKNACISNYEIKKKNYNKH